MIRRQDHADYLLIRQHDHALLAGELAGYFGNADFAQPPRRESALAGIAQHDAGWALHDDAPTINPAGQPLDVFESPCPIALKVWGASVDRAIARDAYGGLLVSLHVLSLSVFATTQSEAGNDSFGLANPANQFAVAKFQQTQLEKQATLRLELGLRCEKSNRHGAAPRETSQKSEDELMFNFRLLQAMDAISLAVCCTQPPWPKTRDLFPRVGAPPMHLELHRIGNDLSVSPWPFDRAAIELKIPGTRIPARPYRSDDDLRQTLAAAPKETLGAIVRAVK